MWAATPGYGNMQEVQFELAFGSTREVRDCCKQEEWLQLVNKILKLM